MKEIATTATSSHLGAYCTSWLLAFVAFGILAYILDRHFISGWFGNVYKMTHKGPKAKESGIIYGRSSRTKFFWAFIASTVQSIGLYCIKGLHYDPLTEVILWAFEIPAMVIGFGLGYLIWPWWEKRFIAYRFLDVVDEKVEDWQDQRKQAEKDDGSPKQEKPIPSEQTIQTTPVPSIVTPEPVKEVRQDPRDRIKEYTQRR